MTSYKTPILYKQYHIDKNDERLGLFTLLEKKFAIKSALYPGSFVHITPSFVFPLVVYVDNFPQTSEFFNDPKLFEFIDQRKLYKDKPVIRYNQKDYRLDIGESLELFDLLISQHAGFVSHFCTKYLKLNGLLIVNNSHGDASMASIDDRYELIGVFNKRREKYVYSNVNLDSHFIPKKPIEVTKKYLQKIQRGIGYKKSASSYLFRRIK
ncbi:MAG: hypothetical protein NWE83_03690 [Candidatus Bathyarchaeota archaeon]|nr:hypothetical protein [Candidatus Bathyarchaeota archaeon]